jgi:hypothetical protein
MKVLVAGPPELRALAERVARGLADAGHHAAADASAAGGWPRRSLAQPARRPEVVVLLIAPGTLGEDSRSRHHLERAARRWPDPAGRVIPLLIRPTPLDEIPPYLRSVTLIVPAGDPTADVLSELVQLSERRTSRLLRRSVLLTAGLAVVVTIGAVLAARSARPAAPGGSAIPFDTIVLPDDLARRARVVATAAMPELADGAAACVRLSRSDEARCTEAVRQELERYYFVGATDPDALLRISHDGVVVGHAQLTGEPRAVAISGDTVYVATASPDAVHAFVGDSLSPTWTRAVTLPSSRAGGNAAGRSRTGGPSTVPVGIVAVRDTLWLLTGGRPSVAFAAAGRHQSSAIANANRSASFAMIGSSGAPYAIANSLTGRPPTSVSGSAIQEPLESLPPSSSALLALGRSDGPWRWIDAAVPGGRPLHLRRVDRAVWVVMDETGGGRSLVRVAPEGPVIYEAAEHDWTACADDVADAGGELLVVSCDDELLGLRLRGDRADVLLRYGRLPRSRGLAHGERSATQDGSAAEASWLRRITGQPTAVTAAPRTGARDGIREGRGEAGGTVVHTIASGLAGWTIAIRDGTVDPPVARVVRVVPGAQPWIVLERANTELLSVAAAAGTTFIIARERAGDIRAWLMAGSRRAVAPTDTPR